LNYLRALGPAEILELLDDLGERLSKAGESASVYIAGGAAMSIAFSARESTQDIDAVVTTWSVLKKHVDAIAEDRGLSPKWLNSSFQGYLPNQRTDSKAQTSITGGLTYSVASAEFLLAMKIHAFRPKDMTDIAFLIAKLDMRDADDIALLTTELYGEDVVPEVDYDECRKNAARALRASRR